MSSVDDVWIYDSLVNYLAGPVWNLPISNFIENKSIVFESDGGSEDDYKEIYDDYKNLVDFMLAAYMEDIQITKKQFETACKNLSRNIKNNNIIKKNLEKIYAADDYEKFRRMMIKTNLDIQLQVLDMLQKIHGIVPESFSDHPVGGGGVIIIGDEEIMREVLRKSLEEFKAVNEEKEEIREFIEQSETEKERIINEKIKLNSTPESESVQVPKTEEICQEDLQKRQAHFREQRDRLIKLKNEEREIQLKKYEDSMEKPSRPKSSIAARKVMTGSSIEPQALQLRRTLIEKLKKEVIDPNSG